MDLIIDIIAVIDSRILVGVNNLCEFIVEWTSCTRATIERTCVVGFLTPFLWQIFFEHASKWWLLLVLLMGIDMWKDINASDTARRRRMVSLWGSITRVILVGYFSLIGALLVLADAMTHEWSCKSLICFVSFVLHMYSVSLPRSREKGKRRKLALSKVKELFGTSWMPTREPRPN